MIIFLILLRVRTSYVVVVRTYRHSDNSVCGYAGTRHSVVRIACQQLSEATKRYREYVPGRFSTSSLPECNYECFVAFCARRCVCVYDLSWSFARPRRRGTGSHRDTDIENVTYAIIRPLSVTENL